MEEYSLTREKRDAEEYQAFPENVTNPFFSHDV